MNCLGEFSRLSLSSLSKTSSPYSMVASSIYRGRPWASLSLSARALPDFWMSSPCSWGFLDVSTLWRLALFIEALGLSPNNEREGRQQLAILKGNI